jgi:hypothetical protein
MFLSYHQNRALVTLACNAVDCTVSYLRKILFFMGFYMIRQIIAVSSLIALSACASAVNGSVQEVSFYTTGADAAICYIEQDGYRQRIWVPQRIHVTRSQADMIITCDAPGNRQKIVVVGSKINNSPVLNAWNGALPGMAYDYGTGAIFSYPDTVEIDFSDMEYAAYELPPYEHMLRDHPEVAGTGMEEFRPGSPALIRDRYDPTPTLRLKEVEPTSGESDLAEALGKTTENLVEKPVGESGGAVEKISKPMISPSVPSSNKAADMLTRKMNPQVFDKQ